MYHPFSNVLLKDAEADLVPMVVSSSVTESSRFLPERLLRGCDGQTIIVVALARRQHRQVYKVEVPASRNQLSRNHVPAQGVPKFIMWPFSNKFRRHANQIPKGVPASCTFPPPSQASPMDHSPASSLPLAVHHPDQVLALQCLGLGDVGWAEELLQKPEHGRSVDIYT